MSGLTGAFALDGQPVSMACIEQMHEAIAHRGPDAHGAWAEGAVGLGHRNLWSTPEAVGVTEPLFAASKAYAIVADARLDNREYLLSKLKRTQRASQDLCDTALILAAYRHWGEACVEHLLGAFAFALWDEKNHHLFCARDHFGVKPFYYAITDDRRFLFGSEIKALLVNDGVSKQLNEERIADYLTGVFYDKRYTFYQQVNRLPPGHLARVTPEGLDIKTYYELRRASDDESTLTEKQYVRRFCELFTEAVRCRMRGRAPIGAMLSGGLDSSSIVSVAQRLREPHGPALIPFSYVYPDRPACDESSYIDQVLAKGEQRAVKIDGKAEVADSFEQLLSIQDEPYFGPNASLVIYARAQAAGCTVLLNGHGGDEVISRGTARLKELAVTGAWLSLGKELHRASLAGTEHSLASRYMRYIRYAIEYHIRRHKTLDKIRRRFAHLAYVLRQRQGGASRGQDDTTKVISEAFAQRIGAQKRAATYRQTWGQQVTTTAEAHYRTLTDPLQVYALEVLDRWNAAFGIEPRYPMWDKRLVEFCLRVPPSLKRREGLGRYILREAMQGVLPEAVRLRQDKTDFTGHLRWKMQHMMDGPHISSGAEMYLDPAVHHLWADLGRHSEALSGSQMFDAQRAHLLSLWLKP